MKPGKVIDIIDMNQLPQTAEKALFVLLNLIFLEGSRFSANLGKGGGCVKHGMAIFAVFSLAIFAVFSHIFTCASALAQTVAQKNQDSLRVPVLFLTKRTGALSEFLCSASTCLALLITRSLERIDIPEIYTSTCPWVPFKGNTNKEFNFL